MYEYKSNDITDLSSTLSSLSAQKKGFLQSCDFLKASAIRELMRSLINQYLDKLDEDFRSELENEIYRIKEIYEEKYKNFIKTNQSSLIEFEAQSLSEIENSPTTKNTDNMTSYCEYTPSLKLQNMKLRMKALANQGNFEAAYLVKLDYEKEEDEERRLFQEALQNKNGYKIDQIRSKFVSKLNREAAISRAESRRLSLIRQAENQKRLLEIQQIRDIRLLIKKKSDIHSEKMKIHYRQLKAFLK